MLHRSTRAAAAALGFSFLVGVGCAGGETPSPAEPTVSTTTDEPKPTSGDDLATKAPTEDTAKDGSEAGDKPDDEMNGRILKRAGRNAANCGASAPAGPFGEVVVHVTIDPSGSMSAKVDAPAEGTDMGHCLENAFVREKVPPWHGSSVTQDITVKIIPPTGAAATVIPKGSGFAPPIPPPIRVQRGN